MISNNLLNIFKRNNYNLQGSIAEILYYKPNIAQGFANTIKNYNQLNFKNTNIQSPIVMKFVLDKLESYHEYNEINFIEYLFKQEEDNIIFKKIREVEGINDKSYFDKIKFQIVKNIYSNCIGNTKEIPHITNYKPYAVNNLKHFLLERKEELEEMELILNKSEIKNILIVGEIGTGRNTLVDNYVLRNFLTGKHFYLMNAIDFSGNPNMYNQYNHFKEAINNLQNMNEDITLIIKDIHLFFLDIHGQRNETDSAKFLKNFLTQNNKIKIIAITDYSNYIHVIEGDEILRKNFKVLKLKPFNDNEVKSILNYYINANSHVIIENKDEIFNLIVDKMKCVQDINSPTKEKEILEMALFHAKHNNEKITKEDIIRILAKKLDVEEKFLSKNYIDVVYEFKNEIKNVIKGQDIAIKEVCKTLNAAIFRDKTKPLATFLFAGPTGVGKTETAKQMARILFGNSKKLIRFDMSEFKNESSLMTLLGAPRGYSNYNQGGLLVTKIRQNPNSIVLFDEIEKAHPQIFDIFLQIFDEGKITDSKGRVGDFSQAIIILTSNIGTELGEDIFDYDETNYIEKARQIKEYIISTNRIRPEILNRLDNLVVYKALNDEIILELIEKKLDNIKKVIYDRLQVNVEFTDDIKHQVLNKMVFKSPREIDRIVEQDITEVVLNKYYIEKTQNMVIDQI